MGVISGIGGAVNGSNTVRGWKISSSADLQKYVASNTQGGAGRLAGNGDWSGQYTAYGHTPAVMPGEAFSFTGTIDGSVGATGTGIVDQVEIVIDIESGAIIAHTVSFSSNGALSLGAAVATDATVPNPPSSIGCKVEFGTVAASPVWTELTDVRTVTITITADNQSYVSSGTAGGTKRTAGNIDATVAISCYTDDFSDLPAVNSIKAVRCYVTSTTYWEIYWGIFGELSDLEVDREGAKPVAAVVNLSLNGFTNVASTPTAGHIKNPAGATFWP